MPSSISTTPQKRAPTPDESTLWQKRTKQLAPNDTPTEITFPFFSLPLELRDCIYDEIWKQIPHLTIRFQGFLFYVEYRRDEEIDDVPTKAKLDSDISRSPIRWIFAGKKMFREAIEQFELHSAWRVYLWEEPFEETLRPKWLHRGATSLSSPFLGESLHLSNKFEGDGPYKGCCLRAITSLEMLSARKAGICLKISETKKRVLQRLGHGIGRRNTLKVIEVDMDIDNGFGGCDGAIAMVDFMALENLASNAHLDKFRVVFKKPRYPRYHLNLTPVDFSRIFANEISSWGKRMLKSEGMESSEFVETADCGPIWQYDIKRA